MRFTVLAIVLGACVTTGNDPTGGGGGGGGGGGSGGGGGGGGSMLPADLVGAWQDVEGDAAIRYEFTAQGGVVYASDLSTSDGCTYDTQTSYTGTVTLQGNVLTLTPSDGMQVSNDCGQVSTSPFTQVEVDAYQVQNGVLYLQNQSTGTVLMLPRA